MNKSLTVFFVRFFLACLPAVFQCVYAQSTVVLNEVVATIDQSVVTRLDLNAETKTVLAQLKSQGIAVPPLDALEKQVLERMILRTVQLNLANNLGIKISDAQVEAVVANIAQQNGTSLEKFKKRMETEGISYTHFYQTVRDDLTIKRVRDMQVGTKIKVTATDLELAQSGSGELNEEWRIGHILIQTADGLNANQLDLRRLRAEEAYKKLQQGESFKSVSAQYSDANDAISTGGVWDWRAPSKMPTIFVEALANLKNGQIAPIVRSPNGFHILQMLDRKRLGAKEELVLQTHVRHILFRINAQQNAAEAEALAKKVKAMLDRKEASFADMAKKYSGDGSSDKGGDLGWVLPGDLVPSFESVMQQLAPTVVSDPVLTPFGYHLIEVLARKKDVLPAERKEAELKSTIFARKYEDAVASWLSQLRGQSLVEVYIE